MWQKWENPYGKSTYLALQVATLKSKVSTFLKIGLLCFHLNIVHTDVTFFEIRIFEMLFQTHCLPLLMMPTKANLCAEKRSLDGFSLTQRNQESVYNLGNRDQQSVKGERKTPLSLKNKGIQSQWQFPQCG